jgi:hypothetical protein
MRGMRHEDSKHRFDHVLQISLSIEVIMLSSLCYGGLQDELIIRIMGC